MDKQKSMKYVNGILTILFALTSIITILSVALAMGLKKESIASWILPHYSRYNLAMAAIKTLEADPQPLTLNGEQVIGKKINKPIMTTVLNIDSPSWPVMINFLKSEIAIRKSDRNYPAEETPSAESKLSDNPTPSHQTDNQSNREINFDRLKAIIVLRVSGVVMSGNKPLEEPFRTVVLWPPGKYRRVYDFMSFEEFRLDFKKMLTNDLEYYSYMLALFGALGTAILPVVKRLLRRYTRDKLITPAPAQDTPSQPTA